ncbi:hypothetical protein PENDEC_c003G04523 [Penicillium decumbens]|uniref:J domain-containing protein n=1 Tax=Penicillium decumbens TaxID=69771 RepID=A0A1V6PJT9_PENDC|nr:hypothetical protein PENDEC_c003G04523 [Penicillium decumbens]
MPTIHTRAMSSSRTIFFFLHTPAPGITSPSLHTCTLRSLSSQHGTRTRPQLQPHKTRFSPSRPSLAFTFTTSARTLEQNYYEVLDIPPTATAAEIKKQFYALSLRHHPDRNRSDPDASQRFARISSAYNTLGNASRRATYDREHNINPQPHRQPAGSHSSHSANLHKGYAGSRAPSGLSRRRGTYRGPPPSFYQQGGYGSTGRTEAGSWKAGAEYANEAANGAGVNKKRDPEDWRGFIERNPEEG